jgi:flagellar biosynthesis anti-sigma factor FlgM
MSVQAEDYQSARKTVAAVPDIRTERIGSIQARIAAGTYNIAPKDIAAKIFQGLE